MVDHHPGLHILSLRIQSMNGEEYLVPLTSGIPLTNHAVSFEKKDLRHPRITKGKEAVSVAGSLGLQINSLVGSLFHPILNLNFFPYPGIP